MNAFFTKRFTATATTPAFNLFNHKKKIFAATTLTAFAIYGTKLFSLLQ
jgi:hypothetical protein